MWSVLDGKKTVIAAILKALADIVTAAGYPEVAHAIDVIGNALLTVGLSHKVVKGAKK